MGGRRKQTSENSLKGHRMSPIRNGRGVNERKYNMNTKGKIDFTKTDNILTERWAAEIDEVHMVAKEIPKANYFTECTIRLKK